MENFFKRSLKEEQPADEAKAWQRMAEKIEIMEDATAEIIPPPIDVEAPQPEIINIPTLTASLSAGVVSEAAAGTDSIPTFSQKQLTTKKIMSKTGTSMPWTRAAYRFRSTPDLRVSNGGFRLVR